jgi:hypothetical protein
MQCEGQSGLRGFSGISTGPENVLLRRNFRIVGDTELSKFPFAIQKRNRQGEVYAILTLRPDGYTVGIGSNSFFPDILSSGLRPSPDIWRKRRHYTGAAER